MNDGGQTDTHAAFAAWLDVALAVAPEDAVAFYFNLYEYEDAYSIQVVSTNRFRDDDPEWAVGPVFFMPDNYLFFTDRLEGDDDWRRALDQALELVTLYLVHGQQAAVLKRSRGVGCGFVDGDEYILWSAK